MTQLGMKVKVNFDYDVKFSYELQDGVVVPEFIAVCKDIKAKGMIDKGSSIVFDTRGNIYWLLRNGEKVKANVSFHLYFNFLDTNPNSSKYYFRVAYGEIKAILITTKEGWGSSSPFEYERIMVDGVRFKDMSKEEKFKLSNITRSFVEPEVFQTLINKKPEITPISAGETN